MGVVVDVDVPQVGQLGQHFQHVAVFADHRLAVDRAGLVG